MKKSIFITFVLLLLLGNYYGHAQRVYVVRERPVVIIKTQPLAPSPRHIWVTPEWIWRGGRYVQADGYWALPPRPGFAWVPGRWAERPGQGWFWVRGHWRRI